GKNAVEFNVIKKAFKLGGFKRTNSSTDFNIFWGKRLKPSEFAKLNKYQKVNHFPGTYQLGRKDNLYRNLSRLKRMHNPKEFDFFPMTWILPGERNQLIQEIELNNKKHLYIVKPKASSCGRGIKIIHSVSQIPKKECIVQRYIDNPFTINRKKFDLRLYVAVTSFDPLKIY